MKISEFGYFWPSTNVRDTRLGAPDVNQLAAAIAALPPRKPLGQSSGDVVPFAKRAAK